MTASNSTPTALTGTEASTLGAARPLASVVVLGYNGREYIEDCLASLLDQDLASDQYEVLYVDNGSRDGSASLVHERFPQVRVLELDHNYGYAEGNNIAFRETRGDFVVFLNQDTVLHRSCVRELVEAVRSAPDIGAGYANVIQPWYPEFGGLASRAGPTAAYASEVNRLGYIHYRRLPSLDVCDTLFLHCVCAILRRDVAEQLGYVFDAAMFAYAEDLDLGLRLRALGYRSVVAPRAVVYHKHTLDAGFGPGTVTKTVRIIRNRHLAFYKVMSAWELAIMAPLTTIGAPLNAREFGLTRGRQFLYGLALVPATAAALVAALASMPRYAAKRRAVRDRATRKSWALRAIWSAARS
jgi:GT2 family glycosyltransferase